MRAHHKKHYIVRFFRKNKFVIPTIVFVLAIVLGFFLWQEHKQYLTQEAVSEKYEQTVNPLYEQLGALKQDLEQLESDYESAETPIATAQIVFTELDPRVYELCYPIMAQRGFVGVLALSDSELPGQSGCMSFSQFNELIENGWTTCVRIENPENSEEYLSSFAKNLKNCKSNFLVRLIVQRAYILFLSNQK